MMLTPSFEKMLAALRMQHAVEVPYQFLDLAVLDMDIAPLSVPDLTGPLRLAIDLDDMLLHSSHMSPSLWELGGYQGKDILPGFVYSKMRTNLRGHAQRLIGRARYDTISKTHHPFMRNPRVVVAPNTAMLSFLAGMKAKGATLVLATASARQRLEYLFTRMPVLQSLFGPAVITAEDLAMRSFEAAVRLAKAEPAHQDESWKLSAAAHAARPYSLSAKTPWALAPAFDGAAYDFLIDDSKITAKLFHAQGLEDRLISVSKQSFGPRAWDSVAMCYNRIFGDDSFAAPVGELPLLRFEDPYYWPCMHVTDQLNPESLHG